MVVNCSAFPLPNDVNYCPSYVASDTSPIAVDGVNTALVQFVGLAGLIALVLIGGYVLNKMRKHN